MRKLMDIAAVICCMCVWGAAECQAQRILEKSSKKRPDWIGGVKQGNLTGTANEKDVDKAMKAALDDIKVQMLSAVAQNYEVSTETLIEQITKNQDVESNIEFRQKSESRVANLPFISGISVARAKDSYWEKYESKDTKEQGVAYYLLYPFSSADYDNLKAEFDKLDKKHNDFVKANENPYNVGSVEELLSLMGKLAISRDFFLDKQRKEWAVQVIAKYKTMLGSLALEHKCEGKNSIQCWISYKGRAIDCEIMPKMNANCATQLDCKKEGHNYRIVFNTDSCIDDDENYVRVTFKLGNTTLKKNIYFSQAK